MRAGGPFVKTEQSSNAPGSVRQRLLQTKPMRQWRVIELRSAFLIFSLIACVTPIGMAAFAQGAAAGEDQHQSASIPGSQINQSQELRIGQKIKAEILKGQTHLYRVAL